MGSDEPKISKQGHLVFQTVCHGGDSFKLYYYTDSMQFHCYTKCGDSFDIYEVVMRAKKTSGIDLTFGESIKHVASLTGKHLTSTSEKVSYQTNDMDWINRAKGNNKKKIDGNLRVYDERVLDVFLPYPHEEWIKEGIGYNTQKLFKVGYYQREDRITIPQYNIDNELIGIRGRAMLQEDIDAGKKYMPLTVGTQLYSFPTMFNLYGLNITKNAAKKKRKIGIFEAEKSVMKAQEIYGENNWTVATGGSAHSRFHRDIILGLETVEEVILFPDREFREVGSKAEKLYQKTILKYAQMYAPYFRTYVCWDRWDKLDYKSSPIDHGKEAFEFLMQNKIEIKTKDEVIH